jgi:hypothetical protein
MARKTDLELERLRRLLVEGDPLADGNAPDATELERMRRRVLAAADAAPRPVGVPTYALAAAAVIVLTVALGWGLWREGAPGPGPAVEGLTEPASLELPTEHGARQIHFSTPGGTRVVWTLDPDFKV